MLNQNPRQADFVLGTCPHCQKVVRIPVTAVTSQSTSHVGCPICSKSFELASVLEEMIPAVRVGDDTPDVIPPIADKPKPTRINAIDTPELFHSLGKEEYEPLTQKKNGRYVVPELLSKGIDKKKNRKKSRRRRSSNDPDVAKSLAKLRENTSSTSLEKNRTNESSGKENEHRHRESGERSSSRKKGSSRSKSTGTRNSGRSRSSSGLIQSILDLPKRLRKNVHNNLSSDVELDSSRADIIMLALGAMIAIPLLHLLMWWFIGVDPLGLAKPTGRIVPFIVPTALREPTATDSTIPAEPSQQTIVDDGSFFESDVGSSANASDGKLPKPKIDPSSVHVDEVN